MTAYIMLAKYTGEAFAATMADQDFLADAAKQKMPIEPTSGTEAQRPVAAIYKAAKPELVEKVRNAMSPRVPASPPRP